MSAIVEEYEIYRHRADSSGAVILHTFYIHADKNWVGV
jgi:hypothetical protein